MNNKSNVRDVLEDMRESFLENAHQKLESLDEQVNTLWADRGAASSVLSAFRGIVHSLKGLGGSFGFPQVTMVCHHLETFVADWGEPTDAQLDGAQAFLDSLRRCLEFWPAPPDSKIQEIVDALPGKMPSEEPAAEEQLSDVKVLLVVQTDTIRQLGEFYLTEFGCQVTVVKSPAAAFEAAIEVKPALVLSSVVLDGLSGTDLIAALRAMKILEGTRFALLSSSSDALTENLPEDVAIISTIDLERGIEQTLDTFGL
jgi:chemotaxis protein histidine kinase CheA